MQNAINEVLVLGGAFGEMANTFDFYSSKGGTYYTSTSSNMAGLVMFTHKKNRGPGTKGFAFIYFLPSGLRSTQKVPGAPARCQASFLIALKLFAKTFLVGSIKKSVMSPSCTKNWSKTQKPNFRGQAIQELIFPAVKQIL